MVHSKILLLTNLEPESAFLMKMAIGMSNEKGSKLSILHVKTPLSVVNMENQLTAKRAIYDDHRTTLKKLEELLSPIPLHRNVTLEVRYGHLKSTVKEYAKEYDPDIIIVGSKKTKRLAFMGDGLVNWLTKRFKNIIVANPDESLHLQIKQLAI